MEKLLHTLMLIFIASAFSACGEGKLVTGDETDSTLPKLDENGQIIDPKTNKPLPPAFEISRENAQLLPFHVRMAKLQRVVGLSQESPAFEDLNRNRYALGDHNYGQGIGADLSWSAAKMSTWVKSIKPVCNSAAMRERYPSLPEHFNEFVVAAYGREANEQDLVIVEDALTEEAVPDEQRYETTCLAVLSSMEFVGR